MKKRFKIAALLVFMFLVNSAGAQKILFGAGGGYATFSMSDLKDYNTTVQNNLPFSPEVTDNFPAWFYLNADVLYSFPRLVAAGLTVSTTSTGSRLHLADYSGEYSFDMQTHSWFPGVKVLLGKAPGRTNGPCFSLEGGMAFSSMSFDEKIAVYEEETNDQQDFSAHGFFVKPGLTYMYHVGSQLIVSANVSYYLGFESGYYVKGNSGQKITNTDTGKRIKPNWNGLRAGLVLYWGKE